MGTWGKLERKVVRMMRIQFSFMKFYITKFKLLRVL